MNEMKEKSRREKEKFRLETEKMKHELIVLKLKAKEVKARTEYYVTAQKSVQDKPAKGETHQIGQCDASDLKYEQTQSEFVAGSL